MTLGTWFRDYVYIPLGGNRVAKWRWLFNVLVVWMITGLWHGAAWNFVLWGLYFAVLLIIEKLWLLRYLEKGSWWNHIYTMFFVVMGFVIFNADSVHDIGTNIGGLFGFASYPLCSEEFIYYFKSYIMIFVIAVVGATPLPRKLINVVCRAEKGRQLLQVLEVIGLVFVMLVATGYLVDGSFNPFLYFRF